MCTASHGHLRASSIGVRRIVPPRSFRGSGCGTVVTRPLPTVVAWFTPPAEGYGNGTGGSDVPQATDARTRRNTMGLIKKLAVLGGAAEAARRYAQKNPDKAGRFVDQAADFVDKQTKGKYKGQISGAAGKVKGAAGIDRPGPGV
ncbi:antitoxin [Pseudonocardia sulfidoxydans]